MAATRESVFPSLVVFDLDECVWKPEMYTLTKVPTVKDAVRGQLPGGVGEGVVGVRSGRETISIFPGAMHAIQSVLQGKYGGEMRLACASSADTPLACRIGRAAMAILEVLPGVTLLEAFRTAGGGFGFADGNDHNLQIGRTAPLSSNKAASHFPILRKATGVPYKEMLFFDDCNWTDHCVAVERELGVVSQRTPRGLTVDEWERGLLSFRERRGRDAKQ